jgi:MSHA biogenesis protein MshO
MKNRGFTLIELLMVVVIVGILAAAVTIFLKPAIDSYLDVRRRAEFSDMADTALRRMGQDIRRAVPNSIHLQSPSCFQLVPTTMGGRYRLEVDANSAALGVSRPLDPTTTTTEFDVLNRLPALAGAVGDWVVVNNQNKEDVYSGANRALISAVQTPPVPGGITVGQHRVSIAAKQFAPGYDQGRFVVVDNDVQSVFYSCVGNTLYRTVAGFGADRAATCAATGGAVVATNIGSCVFTYDPNQGATQQSGFLQMQLTLTGGGESVTLLHGVHVENAP